MTIVYLTFFKLHVLRFRKKGFLVFQMPFADDEIGALSYRGDGIGYVVIN